MKYGALFGWGIVFYSISYLESNLLGIYNFSSTWTHILLLVTLILTTTIAARSLHFLSWLDILPYSIFWTLEVIGLDIISIVPFMGWGMYGDWHVWVNYGLVTLLPLCAPYTQQHPATTRT